MESKVGSYPQKAFKSSILLANKYKMFKYQKNDYMYIHVCTQIQCCILILMGEEEKRLLEVNTFQMLAKEDKVKERATSYPVVPLEP